MGQHSDSHPKDKQSSEPLVRKAGWERKVRHQSRAEKLAAMPKVKEGRPLEVGPLGPDCFVIA